MKCKEIIKFFEEWAPKEIAWQRDNVGLQVGSIEREIENILLSLDFTDKVLKDAIKKRCNLIITHHPFLFNPLRKVDIINDKRATLLEKLIKNNITLYSAHTNLDFTTDGVSFQLAKKLNLKDISFLVNLKANQYKLIVFVPVTFIDKVSNAIFNAGGGIIGDYSKCSFRSPGSGTFVGSVKTKPYVGEKSNFEKVDEIKLEVLVNSWELHKIISAMKKAHPYEEVAYDVIPLENFNVNYGNGAIGKLNQPMSTKDFLMYVAGKLKIKNFRFTMGKKTKVSKIAVCGGSGSEYIQDAVNLNADAFITADLKYHIFQEIEGKLLLIDAGHYETEIHSLNEIKRRLTNFLNENNSHLKVFKFSGSTNPIIFYNN